MYPQIDRKLGSSSMEEQAIDYMALDLTADEMTVDTRRYYDKAFAELERHAVWDRCWQIACRVDDVPETGSFYEYEVGLKAYLITRDEHGEIHGFHNACRHRGNRLCIGSGKVRRTITCPYHLWQYGLDGELVHASDEETFVDLKKAELGLKQVSVAIRWGFVFLNPDLQCEPLDDFLGPFAEFVDRFNPSQMIPVGMNKSTEIECNWKIVVEAFEESYHVQGVHPQNLPMSNDIDRRFAFYDPHRMFVAPFGNASPRLGEVPVDEVVDAFGLMEEVFKGSGAPNPMEPLVASYRDETGEIRLPQGVTLRKLAQQAERSRSGQPGGPDYSKLTDAQLTDITHISVFPNVVFAMRADEVNMFRMRPDPKGDPERCVLDFTCLRVVTDPEERRKRYAPMSSAAPDESMGLAIDQDREMMPRQQRGIRSHDFAPLVLSRQEVGIAHFHAMLDKLITRCTNEYTF